MRNANCVRTNPYAVCIAQCSFNGKPQHCSPSGFHQPRAWHTFCYLVLYSSPNNCPGPAKVVVLRSISTNAKLALLGLNALLPDFRHVAASRFCLDYKRDSGTGPVTQQASHMGSLPKHLSESCSNSGPGRHHIAHLYTEAQTHSEDAYHEKNNEICCGLCRLLAAQSTAVYVRFGPTCPTGP